MLNSILFGILVSNNHGALPPNDHTMGDSPQWLSQIIYLLLGASLKLPSGDRPNYPLEVSAISNFSPLSPCPFFVLTGNSGDT